MAMKFTQVQENCITQRNKDILVSAAAGSGKTTVLVERIVRRLSDAENPIDIDRLLVVTFTKAAAAEMKGRIEEAIYKKLVEQPDNAHLQRQTALIHNAQITTIDAFSLFIVKNHFNEIGLDPGFRTADEAEIKMIKKEVLDELLEEKYREGSKEFLNCVRFFCPELSDEKIEEYIQKLSKVAAAMPWPADWLQERKNDYRKVGDDSEVSKFVYDYMVKMTRGCKETYENIIDICSGANGPDMYLESVTPEYEQINRLTKTNNLEEFKKALSEICFIDLSRKKGNDVDPVLRKQVQELRNSVKTVINKDMREALLLDDSHNEECAAAVDCLVDLTLEFDRRVLLKKQDKRILDFSDMEHYALDILVNRDEFGNPVPSKVALEYREYFEEIMIDEYQDSNLVQDILLSSVARVETGRRNMFMVGDIKQSIYRFRQARPELFKSKYEQFVNAGDDYLRIDLSSNFRSRLGVIDGINGIFSAIMTPDNGGILYDDAAALHAEAKDYPMDSDNKTEVILYNDSAPRVEKDGEPKMVALKIEELVRDFQVLDKNTKQMRPALYSDIVILLRSSAKDELFRKALEERGIPAYIESKKGFFSQKEVQDVLMLLKVLDNPLQDIPLFGTMKSVFGGFSNEELAVIRAANKKANLYDAIEAYAKTEGELAEKVQKFIDMVETYRAKVATCSIHELLLRIYADFGYVNYVYALPAGEKRRNNVEMLLTKAKEFEKTSYFGLFKFINYIDGLEEFDIDYGEASNIDENANVVRIMTIHKSKGLEFPIVFLANVERGFNKKDTSASLLTDYDFGIGINYFDPDSRVQLPTFRKKAIAGKLLIDGLAEEIRVLYVALTRAREKLFITGSVKDSDKFAEECETISGLSTELTFVDFCKSNSYLSMIKAFLKKADIALKFVSGEDLIAANIESETTGVNLMDRLYRASDYADSNTVELLKKRFAYVYPFENRKELFTKTSVSELKMAAMEEADEGAYSIFEQKEVIPYIPKFARTEEETSGTTRGSAVHRWMEILNFDRVFKGVFNGIPADYSSYLKEFNPEKIKGNLLDYMDEMAGSYKLTQEYRSIVNPKKIVNFLSSNVAYRMWKADKCGQLFREQPFVYGIGADRLKKEFPAEEKVLIQGIIDVFFIEDGKIVLLDYKTDVAESFEILENRYRTQFDYYAEALESIKQRPVAEKIIYSFYLEKENAIL